MDKIKLKMTEAEIRPRELAKKLEEYIARDIELWLLNKDQFVRGKCPACECDKTVDPVEVQKLTFETCAKCQTVFYNPRPTLEHIHYYYENAESYHFWAKHIFPKSENARREKIFIPLVNMICNLMNESKNKFDTLMEIGAGFGIFCEELSKREIVRDIIAVEPTPYLAEICRKKGLNTIPTPYEKLDTAPESIDIITSFEVIEHLLSPKDFLMKCFSLLKNEGFLVLTCPNIKGFDFEVLGKEKAPNFGSEHINMFHPDSIKILLETVGFAVIDIQTPGQIDADIVRNQVLEGKFTLEYQPFLKRVLIDEWEALGGPFQKFLSDNKLSSNMLVVAKKVC